MLCDLGLLLEDSIRIERISAYHNTVPRTGKHFICLPGQKNEERLFYIAGGRFTITSRDETLTAEPGSILYLPGGIDYVSDWEDLEHAEYYSVQFFLFDRSNRRICLGSGIEKLIDGGRPNILSDYKALFTCWTSGSQEDRYKCLSLFWQLIYDLKVLIRKDDLKSRFRCIYKGIIYLEENYAKDVTVDELARICALSTGTFRRIFKQYKSVSPVRYRNLLRMRRAKELLESGEYTVNEAGKAVGCCDPYYFSKMFKAEYGRNPSEFIPSH